MTTATTATTATNATTTIHHKVSFDWFDGFHKFVVIVPDDNNVGSENCVRRHNCRKLPCHQGSLVVAIIQNHQQRCWLV